MFAVAVAYFNQPQLIVGLFDQNEQAVGEVHVYYGQGILCGHFADNVLPTRGWQYTEPPSAAGVHRLDLTRIGDNLDFSKVRIYLINYTCEGVNSIVFDELKVLRDCG